MLGFLDLSVGCAKQEFSLIELWGAKIDTLQLGVGAIPVLCCAMIWILLYRGYGYIFMDFIGWTGKDFFPHSRYCVIREREVPCLIINQNRIVFAPNTRSAFQKCTQTGLQ